MGQVPTLVFGEPYYNIELYTEIIKPSFPMLCDGSVEKPLFK